MTFHIHRNGDGKYRWTLVNDTTKKKLAVSEEAYVDKRDCMASIAKVKMASNDKIVEAGSDEGSA